MFNNNDLTTTIATLIDGYISEDEQSAMDWWSTQWTDLDLGDAPESPRQRTVPSVLTKV
jgi:hypothetical protein